MLLLEYRDSAAAGFALEPRIAQVLLVIAEAFVAVENARSTSRLRQYQLSGCSVPLISRARADIVVHRPFSQHAELVGAALLNYLGIGMVLADMFDTLQSLRRLVRPLLHFAGELRQQHDIKVADKRLRRIYRQKRNWLNP